MKRYLLLAAAIAMMTMMTVQADEPAPPSQPANAVVDSTAVAPVLKVELTTLKIVNGQASLCVKTRCYGAVALKDLSPSIAFVAKTFKNATYATDGKTLVIGIREKGQKPNAVLVNIAWKSDCSNNSQFQAEEEVPQFVKAKQAKLREALIAWTRWRHDSPQAVLLRLRQSNDKHWDVQLVLKTLVSLR